MKLFNQDKMSKAIFLPPPNITGLPHIGHFYNVLLQDLYIRTNSDHDDDIQWIGGIDHAGIGAEYILNKKLKKENLSKNKIGYQRYLQRMLSWKEEISKQIISTINNYNCYPIDKWVQTIGGNVDYFVYKTFIALYKDKLIYRDKKTVNYCLHCSTTLSDLEVIYEEEKGILYTVQYGDSSFSLAVSTTRPETILADVALAVNPNDKRYKDYIGKTVKVPLSDRAIPIIADKTVDINYGTGVLKITPAHSLVDYKIALNHSLKLIELFGMDGKIKLKGKFYNLPIDLAREKVVQSLNLLEVEEIKHNLPICSKCNSTVEAIASNQFFLKVDPLIDQAKLLIESEGTKYHPYEVKEKLIAWFDNMHDWCISRQLWWGHKLPIDKEMKIVEFSLLSKRQDLDVLDTWFSSALWQFIAGGIDNNGIPKQPLISSKILFSGYDIMAFWISKMILLSPYVIEHFNLNSKFKLPVQEIALHGLLRDKNGKKLSKTSGNALTLDSLLEKYPMKDLKLSFILATSSFGNDLKVEEKNLILIRNFLTKLENLFKFIALNKEKYLQKTEKSYDHIFNHYIYLKINKEKEIIKSFYREREYGKALRTLINFIWHEFCDWYLELIKIKSLVGNKALPAIVGEITGMLDPFIPGVKEEYKINELKIESQEKDEFNKIKDCICSRRVESIKELIVKIRTIFACQVEIEDNRYFFIEGKDEKDYIFDYLEIICKLTRSQIFNQAEKQEDSYVLISGERKIVFPKLKREKLKSFLDKKILKLKEKNEYYSKKLENRKFIEYAPEKIVYETREKLEDLNKEINSLTSLLE